MNTRQNPVVRFSVAAALAVALASTAGARQADELRIVVLEGEDNVNIVAQGTAVPTLVEVRDRNDLPVAGATVVFLLDAGGGAATLNAGLSQVTATTNALGQAAVSVNPVASGAVQLQVNAAFQGQTATATIAQTNFATAAEAAAAGAGTTGGGGGTGGGGAGSSGGGGGSGAAAAGGGAAGGGGIGTGAIVGIAAAGAGAAAAGIAVATQADPCAFSVSPSSFDGVDGGGANLRLAVSANPVDCQPAEWTAQSNAAFISVSPAGGSGSGSVTLTVGTNGPDGRTGTVTVAGQTVRIAQDATATPCDEQVLPGGDAPETHRVGLGRFNGRFDFQYDTQYQEDRMLVRYEGQTLLDTGCVGTRGWRTATLSFSGRSSVVEVEVIPNCAGGSGTAWEFSVSCAVP